MEEEFAQPWIKNDSDSTTKSMLMEVEQKDAIRRNSERYRIIASLLSGQETDITGDPVIFAAFNKERMAIEDYMKLFPKDMEDALWAVNRDKEFMEGPNRKSLAYYYAWGHMPACVDRLYREVYPDEKARKSAYRRFFNTFTDFRIPNKPI